MAAVPGYSHRDSSSLCGPTTPGTFACSRFGPFPFRSPLLWESQLIFIPAGTEMCHFPAFTVHASMDSKRANPDYSGLGCPIRRSRDPLVCSSPWLIAAYHVLHRLSAPRHPPYTLSNLTALIPLPELHSSVSVRMCVASRRHNRAGPLRTDFNGCTVVQQLTTPRTFPLQLDFKTPIFNFQRATAYCKNLTLDSRSRCAPSRFLLLPSLFGEQLLAEYGGILMRQTVNLAFCLWRQTHFFYSHVNSP